MLLDEKNQTNYRKYRITSWFYDILDFPWELQYRKWRPGLVGDVRGEVLEAGVGTGRNLEYYNPGVNLTAIDFSPSMLKRAMKRSQNARCRIRLVNEDVCGMESIPSNSFDWVVATFLCCVLPEELQDRAMKEFRRVLKPGGRFRLLEMIHSKNAALRKRQDFFSPFVEKVYGARFDRNTLTHVKETEGLELQKTYFIKHDVYLVIEGRRQDRFEV